VALCASVRVHVRAPSVLFARVLVRVRVHVRAQAVPSSRASKELLGGE